MKLKHLLLSSGLFIAANVAIAAPVLNLSSINSPESLNVTLTVKSASNIKNVKFTGLDSFQVLGRTVDFNTSSNDESSNLFTSKILLAPTKVESSDVYVTANIDGKDYTSNKVTLNITQKQIDDYNRRQKIVADANQKQAKIIQRQVAAQMKAQQKYFDDMSKIMEQQQKDMQKAQEQLMKNLNSLN